MEGCWRCVVCGKAGRNAAKYRCPGCRERYCSLPCYKKHKELCISRGEPPSPSANRDASKDAQRGGSFNAEGSPWTVDDILTEDDEGDKVPLHKLQLLGESEELKDILLNPHLRQLLANVDRAEDKSSLLRKYMQEPLFVEFADCCLRVVEPPEEENEDVE
ncbi:zinc finger HIT domain-containing protein 3 [Sceloporus undulatus]|uniref:zinc finger HIT domain-containing protein 3 n=1 Tax=Sceloporus undulatus TaxID=8520 RepID=UPI001C4C6CEB|nr:zinc finger HIT domain-containing protein 3 [Sceloporus undulatus]